MKFRCFEFQRDCGCNFRHEGKIIRSSYVEIEALTTDDAAKEMATKLGKMKIERGDKCRDLQSVAVEHPGITGEYFTYLVSLSVACGIEIPVAQKHDDEQSEMDRHRSQIQKLESAIEEIRKLVAVYEGASRDAEDVMAHVVVLKVREIIDRLEPSPTKDHP